MAFEVKETAGALVFKVYVQPRSSKISIVGRHQDALKIKLTAPPVDGAANKQCIQVLAKALGMPKSAVSITSGQTSRMKQIRIQPAGGNLTPSDIKSLKNTLDYLASK